MAIGIYQFDSGGTWAVQGSGILGTIRRNSLVQPIVSAVACRKRYDDMLVRSCRTDEKI